MMRVIELRQMAPSLTMARMLAGIATAAARSETRTARAPGGQIEYQTPGAPARAWRREIARNAKWYWTVTLRTRVTSVSNRSTAADARPMATYSARASGSLTRRLYPDRGG